MMKTKYFLVERTPEGVVVVDIDKIDIPKEHKNIHPNFEPIWSVETINSIWATRAPKAPGKLSRDEFIAWTRKHNVKSVRIRREWRRCFN